MEQNNQILIDEMSAYRGQVDVNYHRLKPVACERLSETKQLD